MLLVVIYTLKLTELKKLKDTPIVLKKLNESNLQCISKGIELLKEQNEKAPRGLTLKAFKYCSLFYCYKCFKVQRNKMQDALVYL
jgi:hypothetical protein